jgi:F-type H+-transporting ATPase subunit c
LTLADFEEDFVSRRLLLVLTTVAVVGLALAAPVHAQETAAGAASVRTEVVRWSIITAGFALAIAAAFGAISQARGLSAAVEGIARNPSAAGEIRGNLILGLVLIESLVIYVLLISLILFFVTPFGK